MARARGPWRHLEDVEFATPVWVDWFHNRRVLEPIGNILPGELEEAWYRSQDAPAEMAGLTGNCLRNTRGGSPSLTTRILATAPTAHTDPPDRLTAATTPSSVAMDSPHTSSDQPPV